ncbi:hypothetical protein G6F57_022961 [Rhizopus arrhizus]|nr:hypothetical protein G6F57_022961 [Rhizopus arrhizus]
MAMFERARHAPGGGHADAGALVDLAVWHALLQQRHHFPSIGHGFQLGRGTQVTQEGLDLFRLAQRGKGLGQGLQVGLRVFGGNLGAGFHGVVSMHQCNSALVH